MSGVNPEKGRKNPGAGRQDAVKMRRTSLRLERENCRFVVLIALVLAGAVALSCGCVQTGSSPGNGTLTGNVSIGPLCPVEPCSIPPERLAAAYAARPIIISTQDGKRGTSVVADPVTGYSVSLAPGTYVVDVPHQGIGGSPELPQTVTIGSGETVRLDISVDTGIR